MNRELLVRCMQNAIRARLREWEPPRPSRFCKVEGWGKQPSADRYDSLRAIELVRYKEREGCE